MSTDQTLDDEWFEVSVEELAFLARATSAVPSPLEQLTPIAAWLRSDEARAAGTRRLESRGELGGVDQETWEVILRLAAIVGDHDEASLVITDGHGERGVSLVTCASPLGRAQLAVTPAGAGLRPLPSRPVISDVVDSLADIYPAESSPVLLALRLRRGGVVEGVRWDGAVLARRSDADTDAGEQVACARADALIAMAGFVVGQPLDGVF